MEYFDVLDSKRNPLGYTKQRGTALEEAEYNQGCEIYIINDQKLLLTQRCELKSHPLLWEVTGGCSKAGQSSIDTVLAEVEEEIGVTLKESDIEILHKTLYKKMFLDIYFTSKKIEIENLKLQIEEVKDAKWVTLEEFEQMYKDGLIVESVYTRYLELKSELLKRI